MNKFGLTLVLIVATAGAVWSQELASSTNYTATCLPCESNVSHVVVAPLTNFAGVYPVRLYLEVRNPSSNRVFFTRQAITGVMTTTGRLYLDQSDVSAFMDNGTTYNGPISMCSSGVTTVIPVEEARRK